MKAEPEPGRDAVLGVPTSSAPCSLRPNFMTTKLAAPYSMNLKFLFVLVAAVSGTLATNANLSTFTNTGLIIINDSATPPTKASPYPSTITVAGVSGLIENVSVTLSNINHTYPDDIGVLLVTTRSTGHPHVQCRRRF